MPPMVKGIAEGIDAKLDQAVASSRIPQPPSTRSLLLGQVVLVPRSCSHPAVQAMTISSALSEALMKLSWLLHGR